MNSDPRRIIKNWAKLLLGCVSIYLFVFILAPAMQGLPYIEDVHNYVNEHDIDAAALFYTEIDEFGDADVSVRNAMKY